MKKLTCLLFALFVGAFAFAGGWSRPEKVEMTDEFLDKYVVPVARKICKSFDNVEGITTINAYEYPNDIDLVLGDIGKEDSDYYNSHLLFICYNDDYVDFNDGKIYLLIYEVTLKDENGIMKKVFDEVIIKIEKLKTYIYF